MKVDSKTVRDIAHLARLEFDAQGEDKMITDMNRMIGFVEKLSELNTDGIEPLIYMTDEVNRLRDDEVKEPLPHKAVLMNAPKHDSDYFKVPKVVDKK
ncbi:MAG: Asp-tRNA(Asn)/Glu-tRNA(Gln) amidotransferase subunit GatC [Bacteroidota bacterium]|jgi:aspartyl-tRNA(Asn)/glutamyl-tRNA(Gln) amidotransferase subunit C